MVVIFLACESAPPTGTGDSSDDDPTMRVTRELGGRLTASMTLQDTVLYLLTSDLIVPKATTLTIPAGSMILATGAYEIFVQGKIECQGTAEAPVHLGFQKQDSLDDRFWKGIRLEQAEEIGTFQFVEIRQAIFGILAVGSNIKIMNSRFVDNLIAVDVIRGSDLILSDTAFDSLQNQGVVIKSGSSAQIERCTFSVINGVAIECDASSLFLTNSVINDCGWGLRLINSGESLIQRNIFRSGEYGLHIGNSDSVRIVSNTISNYTEKGIYLYNLGKRFIQINRNNIVNPEWNLSLQNVHTSTIDATSCWWGSADVDSVEAKIYHGLDEASLDTVLYSPVQSSEISF